MGQRQPQVAPPQRRSEVAAGPRSAAAPPRRPMPWQVDAERLWRTGQPRVAAGLLRSAAGRSRGAPKQSGAAQRRWAAARRSAAVRQSRPGTCRAAGLPTPRRRCAIPNQNCSSPRRGANPTRLQLDRQIVAHASPRRANRRRASPHHANRPRANRPRASRRRHTNRRHASPRHASRRRRASPGQARLPQLPAGPPPRKTASTHASPAKLPKMPAAS
jgi:hypothetical protein